MLLNDEEKLDCKDDGKEFPNPPGIPPADPCMWWPLWDKYDPPNDPPPVMYVGIGACMGFIEGKPENLSKGPLRRSDMAASFLFFLLLVDIFRFLVWMPSFFIVNGRLTCKRETQYYSLCQGYNNKAHQWEITETSSVSLQLRPFIKWRLLLQETFAPSGNEFFPLSEATNAIGLHSVISLECVQFSLRMCI